MYSLPGRERDPADCREFPLGIRPWRVGRHRRVCRADVRRAGEAPDQVLPAARRRARNHDWASGRRRRGAAGAFAIDPTGAVAVGHPRRFALRGPDRADSNVRQPRLVVRGDDDPVEGFSAQFRRRADLCLAQVRRVAGMAARHGGADASSRASAERSRAISSAPRSAQTAVGWRARVEPGGGRLGSRRDRRRCEPLMLRSGGRPASVAIDPERFLAGRSGQSSGDALAIDERHPSVLRGSTKALSHRRDRSARPMDRRGRRDRRPA